MVQGEHTPVTARASGKINLGLWVGPVDETGFHPLLTAFQAVDVWETVTVSESSAMSLTCAGTVDCSGVPTSPENICWQATVALGGVVGRAPTVHIDITKNVPVAGGMAGGSADAAATLLALSQLWSPDVSQEQLDRVAVGLGSDVPFSLRGGGAIGRGRGDQLEPMDLAQPLHLVLVPSDVSLSTPMVYRRFDEMGLARPLSSQLPDGFVDAWRQGDAEAIAPLMHNDLQAPAVSLVPELADTLAVVDNCGAVRAMVSGSGPTVFGLARNAAHARAIGGQLEHRGYPVVVTQSLIAPLEPAGPPGAPR